MKRLFLLCIVSALGLAACSYVVTRDEFMKTAGCRQYTVNQPLQQLYKKALDFAQENYAKSTALVDGHLFPDLGKAEIDVKLLWDIVLIHFARYEFTAVGKDKTVVTAYYNSKNLDEPSQAQLDWFQEQSDQRF